MWNAYSDSDILSPSLKKYILQVCKVYLGSFNDKPIRTDLNPNGKELFEKEQQNLLQDLYEIPQRSCDRKVRIQIDH